MDDNITKDIRALTINLRKPGIELKADIAWSTLGIIAEKYPELDEYSSEGDINKFKITKTDEKEKDLAHVLISKESISIAVDDVMNFQEWIEYSTNIFDIILENIQLSPLSVIHLDNQHHREWTTELHHFRILFDLFAGDNNKFKTAFPDVQVAQFMPNLSFVLDIDEKIICLLNFKNNSSFNIDLLPEYPDKYELIVGSGIAKVGNYKPLSNLNDVLTKIQSYAEVYHNGKLEEHIFKPINDAIHSTRS